ncbi:DUF2695 domain-containing protein [Microlunatus elymi]|uniref:DUF2695 domain-containing protein n=1 Tax=Microlunatus elymi TaxID=2596828 RepID=A0A516PX15_9ACTN|nr:DUF2695 domain-containing protein [Microlunatus elymi]QDP95734.1 DUF2695 domain-containing protein [Microlunatus elymi]
MTAMDNVVNIEAQLRERSSELLVIRPKECVICYVARMLMDFGCDGTRRWALRYRDQRAPQATALEERLARRGACCCDCEIFLSGYVLVDRLRVRRPLFGELSAAELLSYGYDDEAEATELVAPKVPPPCSGVRRGSVQPCANWRTRTWYDE